MKRVEKKLEITLGAGAKSLKSLPKSYWEHLIRFGGGQVLSSAPAPLCDAYVLTDGSLFVFPHKIVLASGPRLRHVTFIRDFLVQFPQNYYDSLFYMSKGSLPYESEDRSFLQDAEELARLMPGQAHRVGYTSESPLYIFHLDRISTRLKSTESTLEVVLHEVSAATYSSHFAQGKTALRKWICESPELKNLFSVFDIQDRSTDSGTFTLNALKGDRYICLQGRSEGESHSVTFETNYLEQGTESLVRHLCALFQPKRHQVMFWGSGNRLPFSSYANLGAEARLETVFSNGHILQFFHFRDSSEGKNFLRLDLPKFVESKGAEKSLKGDWILAETDEEFAGAKIRKIIFQGEDEERPILLADTESWGLTLQAGREIIFREGDWLPSSELMVHVPLFIHPDPTRILILGNPHCGCAREVLKHSAVFECVCVDSRSWIVDVMREHVPGCSEILADARITLIAEEPVEFLKKGDQCFDVILVDSIGYQEAMNLSGVAEIRGLLKTKLAAGGILVIDVESATHAKTEGDLHALKQVFEQDFSKVFFYRGAAGPRGRSARTFAVLSDSFHPLEDFDREKALKSKIDFSYYNADLHEAAFCLPSRLKNLLLPPSDTRSGGNEERVNPPSHQEPDPNLMNESSATTL